MTTRRSRVILTGAISSGVLVAGLGAYASSHAGLLDLIEHKAPATATVGVSAPTYPAMSPTLPLAPTQAPNYRAIVRQYGPAVVGITVDGVRKADWNASKDGDAASDPFLQFFRGLPGFEFRVPHSMEQPFHGQGSGFIISSDGLILTNAHVVRDARDVMVKLADRRELKAVVLGADSATDIAVLRANVTGLPTVKLGDPNTLQVGDYVLAIGAPFGFEQSATAGIVSAKGRSLPGDASVPFIQSDAAVNPGNSGGPLFDVGGNVIGINAQIYSQSGGYQGLSFAIPIDVALRSKDQIVATGHASHARLGVTIQDLNQALADSFGLNRPDGALVAGVVPDSPAAAAGLRSGDVITRINGNPIERSGDLSSQIAAITPGTHVTLGVWRDHAAREVGVKLASAELASDSHAPSNDDRKGRLGLSLRPLTKEERAQGDAQSGLVVEEATGPAAMAGIEPGDVVLGINGQPAQSVAQLHDLLESHPKSVALLIEREGQKLFVPVQPG